MIAGDFERAWCSTLFPPNLRLSMLKLRFRGVNVTF